jgi:hypothetical protein
MLFWSSIEMIKSYFKVIGLLLLAVSMNTNAALITLSSTDIGSDFDINSSLKNYIENSSSVVSNNITSFDMVPTLKNSVMKLTFRVDLDSALDIDIFAGLDAGLGAEVFVNGDIQFDSMNNFWWKKSWANSNVISLFGQTFDAGMNVVDIYWAENCCGGFSSVSFDADFLATNSSLNIDTLLQIQQASQLATQVPTPATWYVVIGVMAFATARKTFLLRN